jgi:hypothetical protein
VSRRAASADSGVPDCFEETGFCIRDSAIAELFQAHGGLKVFGYPISRRFRLRGEWVQLFQRVAVRLLADGRAEALPLLDELPLSRLNGSELPGPDPALASRRPRPDQPGFEQRADALLREEVPEIFEGRPVGFLRTFLAAAGSDPAPAALSIYGWPSSRPAADPANGDLVYQRFERAILQYSAATGQSQALLLGDYAKSAITGQGSPADLEAEASGNALLHQYNPAAPDGLQRPWELPDSDLMNAFRGDKVAGVQPLFPPGLGRQAGWPAAGSAEGAEIDPSGEEYAVGVGDAGTSERAAAAAASNLWPLRDFVVVVDARLEASGSGGYALYLRHKSEDERFTLVVDAGRRLASFYRRVGGETTMLWDWTPVASLRDASEANRLMVRVVGQRFAVWINGQAVFDLEASGPENGSLWLAAVTWDRPARAIFSNLLVTAPE